MEVIYTPPWQSIAAVVKLALEEDVDVVGISSLATDHLIVPKLMTALRDAGLGHVRVVVGGIVPDNEEELLLESGVREVFHPGSTMDEITTRIRDYAREARRAGATPTGEPDMNKPARPSPARRRRVAAQARWQREYGEGIGTDRDDRQRLRASRSGRSTRRRPRAACGDEPLGYPGQPDYTRGIYATMHRGRTWTQRQLDRPRHAGRLQRAPARPARARRDRGLADPVQLGLPRLRHGLGRARAARHLRRGRQQRRPHGPLPRRRRPRPRLVRDERPVAVHAARLHAGRRGAARHRLEQGSPAPRTRATTSRTTSPTTCSTGSRCRARAAC